MVYCTFKQWLPIEPITYGNIMKDTKIIIDKEALASWST